MRRNLVGNCVAIIVVLFCCLANIRAQETERPDVPGENVVYQWNRVLQDTIRIPGQQPPTIFAVRSYAMMHAAMFDAANSIDGTYTPYLIEIPGFSRASKEAAVAKAAHDVLVSLYPTRAAIYDAELSISIIAIPRNRAQQGITVGERVAAAMIALRTNDGWDVTPPPFVLPLTPGNWQPTPPNFPAPAFTQYPAVLPFAIGSSSRFSPNPPPALTSDEYAAALNEVKELGSATSTIRTADQTRVAQLWAGVNTTTQIFFIWNNVARTVGTSRNLSTVDAARLFALLNIAYHDGLQTTMTSKYLYGFWRPVTAIRRADEDNNPNTSPDPNWLSLITNPPYPSYAGNHAMVGASQATILASFFGRDDIRFQHTWEGPSGMTRSYAGFNAMANEEERARVYGGIHFTFDQVAGQSAGRNVANFVFQNFMTPKRCDFDSEVNARK
jgi:hypothetical protein